MLLWSIVLSSLLLALLSLDKLAQQFSLRCQELAKS
jgi:hypothetical protein